MKKTVKYELTQEEIHLLTKCANEVAQDCDEDCDNGCPFWLVREGQCILARLDEIAGSFDY